MTGGSTNEIFECVIEGIPVSLNNTRKAARAWRAQVAEAGALALGNWRMRTVEEMSASMVLFHEGPYVCDTDNIPKHVLDALKGLAYEDDRIITQVIARRTQVQPGLALINPPALVAAHLGLTPNFLYLRLEGAPNHSWIPMVGTSMGGKDQ